MNIRFWTIVLGIGMCVAGIAHFVVTRKYLPIVPKFLPQRMGIVVISGVVELCAGIGLFIPAIRKEAALTVLFLMIAFLPLHAWDMFRERPAMGSQPIAIVRFALQFVLIYWAWRVWRAS
jgi:uncharacterized membrane protein